MFGLSRLSCSIKMWLLLVCSVVIVLAVVLFYKRSIKQYQNTNEQLIESNNRERKKRDVIKENTLHLDAVHDREFVQKRRKLLINGDIKTSSNNTLPSEESSDENERLANKLFIRDVNQQEQQTDNEADTYNEEEERVNFENYRDRYSLLPKEASPIYVAPHYLEPLEEDNDDDEAPLCTCTSQDCDVKNAAITDQINSTTQENNKQCEGCQSLRKSQSDASKEDNTTLNAPNGEVKAISDVKANKVNSDSNNMGNEISDEYQKNGGLPPLPPIGLNIGEQANPVAAQLNDNTAQDKIDNIGTVNTSTASGLVIQDNLAAPPLTMAAQSEESPVISAQQDNKQPVAQDTKLAVDSDNRQQAKLLDAVMTEPATLATQAAPDPVKETEAALLSSNPVAPEPVSETDTAPVPAAPVNEVDSAPVPAAASPSPVAAAPVNEVDSAPEPAPSPVAAEPVNKVDSVPEPAPSPVAAEPVNKVDSVPEPAPSPVAAEPVNKVDSAPEPAPSPVAAEPVNKVDSVPEPAPSPVAAEPVNKVDSAPEPAPSPVAAEPVNKVDSVPEPAPSPVAAEPVNKVDSVPEPAPSPVAAEPVNELDNSTSAPSTPIIAALETETTSSTAATTMEPVNSEAIPASPRKAVGDDAAAVNDDVASLPENPTEKMDTVLPDSSAIDAALLSSKSDNVDVDKAAKPIQKRQITATTNEATTPHPKLVKKSKIAKIEPKRN